MWDTLTWKVFIDYKAVFCSGCASQQVSGVMYRGDETMHEKICKAKQSLWCSLHQSVAFCAVNGFKANYMYSCSFV